MFSQMANLVLVLLPLFLIMNIISLPLPARAISSCNGPCKSLDDCTGQLICIEGKCNDDPDQVGNNICKGSRPPPKDNKCQPSGTKSCKGKSFSQFKCSPPVTSSTRALLTNNDFSEGGDGWGASSCDESFHENLERVVALSTGWFDGGSRCGKMIKITASNGRSVKAKVVDECDSVNGCDAEHAGQPPCKNNIVDRSDAVWNDLGLNIDDGVVPVTWSMA